MHTLSIYIDFSGGSWILICPFVAEWHEGKLPHRSISLGISHARSRWASSNDIHFVFAWRSSEGFVTSQLCRLQAPIRECGIQTNQKSHLKQGQKKMILRNSVNENTNKLLKCSIEEAMAKACDGCFFFFFKTFNCGVNKYCSTATLKPLPVAPRCSGQKRPGLAISSQIGSSKELLAAKNWGWGPRSVFLFYSFFLHSWGEISQNLPLQLLL